MKSFHRNSAHNLWLNPLSINFFYLLESLSRFLLFYVSPGVNHVRHSTRVYSSKILLDHHYILFACNIIALFWCQSKLFQTWFDLVSQLYALTDKLGPKFIHGSLIEILEFSLIYQRLDKCKAISLSECWSDGFSNTILLLLFGSSWQSHLKVLLRSQNSSFLIDQLESEVSHNPNKLRPERRILLIYWVNKIQDKTQSLQGSLINTSYTVVYKSGWK